MVFLARLFIRGYQILVSPILSFLEGPGGGCRFQPTCSVYFLDALETHGILRGTWLGVCRLGRCHPWGGRGHDPVPPRSTLSFGRDALGRDALGRDALGRDALGRDAALRRPHPGIDACAYHRTAQRTVPTVCE